MFMFPRRRRTLDARADRIDELSVSVDETQENIYDIRKYIEGNAVEKNAAYYFSLSQNWMQHERLNGFWTEMVEAEDEFICAATSSRHLDRYLNRSRHMKIVVLKHPKVTVEQVTALVDDPDSEVRAFARTHEKSWLRVM